ncbi:alpha/beta fold hydrolase [Antrihabitans cavernicola]|uniref:Alpha/beta fold hydrolase n=1 Tax=Antrihabitans cavernicola TaxID=2495913 RepID=A0A5A7S8W8_9NOCA|nr:alpha/beta fold hydrolase [Spelaeibacter cavernicola]KAA0021083.1 alpha/beta fold hydrolase [Spelaeibacter cavernicola]
MRLPRFRRPTRRGYLRIAASVAVLALIAILIATTSGTDDKPAVAAHDESMTLPEAPGSAATVTIDAREYLPAHTPAPAVLLAHGFGGSKESVDGQARALARDGFVVLAYSARGFGKSTGTISLNDPDREVADAHALITWLAGRPEVKLDAPGDPRVGVAGGSYGGALALMLGGTDKRIDAVAAAITWNDLGQALFPNYGTTVPPGQPTPGVLKRGWAGVFFGAGAAPAVPGVSTGDLQTDICGRFDVGICQGYVQAAVTGAPTPELLALLRAHSPTAVARNITAPTLLVQGERDTLFGLDQADANAREIAAGGAPVTVRWFNGGHDGDADRSDGTVRSFLDDQLLDSHTDRTDDPASFGFSLPGTPDEQGQTQSRRMSADSYPGLPGTGEMPQATLQLTEASAPMQSISRPPGASPGAVSSIPGFGSAVSALSAVGGGGLGIDPPGQFATFRTAPLGRAMTVTGSPSVEVRVQSFAAPGESVLFAKLYDVGSGGRRILPGGAVAPIRLPDASGAPVDVRIALPAVAYQIPEGHQLELSVGTTDQAYSVPLSPARFTVSLANSQLTVPSVAATPTSRAVPLAPLVGIGVIAGCLALLIAGATIRSRRRGIADVDPESIDVPIVVTNLSKTYNNGFTAVDGVSFAVQHGQVLGLLGPNGAGKTTTLRMLMGLITPSSGDIRVFGHRITPGAPVLSRLGAFIEGPGLLPHLSGSDNLRLFWQATGRPIEDAHLDEVLAIADLGVAVDRKVRSYSQGMRQRLAIAQAMLGLPDLLVLDEPTNGLDPPQIRTMRDVLIQYARGGRTVVVSSHLLAEVEQTCTHVVVMDRGKVISAGTVADLVSTGGPTEIRVDDAAAGAAALAQVDGIGHVVETDGAQPTLRVDLGTAGTAKVIRALVEAGVAVDGVSTSTRLEDVFLALVHDPRAVSQSDEVAT